MQFLSDVFSCECTFSFSSASLTVRVGHTEEQAAQPWSSVSEFYRTVVTHDFTNMIIIRSMSKFDILQSDGTGIQDSKHPW